MSIKNNFLVVKTELIKVNIPESQLGFLGAGHIACPVMQLCLGIGSSAIVTLLIMNAIMNINFCY
jgi:hypothetical protein